MDPLSSAIAAYQMVKYFATRATYNKVRVDELVDSVGIYVKALRKFVSSCFNCRDRGANSALAAPPNRDSL